MESKKMIQMNLGIKQTQMYSHRKQTYDYQKGKVWGGINQEFVINIYTLIYVKQTTNSMYCMAQGTIFSIS